MNFYGSIVIEHEKNERKYFLTLPVGVSYADAHTAVLEIASGVLEMQKQAESAQQAPVEPILGEVVEQVPSEPEITD